MESIERVPSVRVQPQGLAPLLMLGLIASAGMFSANIMPVLVSALREGLGYSARDAGLVGAADIYGAALGCAAAAVLVRRLPWRPTVAVMLAALIVCDGVSPVCRSFALLLPLRFLHGLFGGLSVGMGFAVIARTPAPDRGFGVLMLLQFWLAGLAVMILPNLAARFGPGVPFLALALLGLAALLALPLIPEYAQSTGSVIPRTNEAPRLPLLLALFSLFLFQLTKMSLYSYLLGFGRALGHSVVFLSTVVGAAAWLGSLGALAVVALGLRFGRSRPLAAAVALATAAYLAFLIAGATAAVFAAAEIGVAVVWAFVAPYLFGMCSAFDAHGRTAAWSSFFSKLGMASGPALGGLVLAETHYGRLLWLAIAGIIGSGLCAAWPALLLDRQARAGSEQKRGRGDEEPGGGSTGSAGAGDFTAQLR